MKTDSAVTVNGRFLTQAVTGVQRYAREISQRLGPLLAEGGATATLLTPEGQGARALLGSHTRPLDTTALGSADERAPMHWAAGHAWEQLVLPWASQGVLLSLANTGPLACRSQIVCMHDANVYRIPESYSPRFAAAYRALLPRLARRVRGISTVSVTSARNLREAGVLDTRAVHVIPNGHEHVLQWDAARSTLDLDPARPFVLVLGSRAPHKNVQVLLRAARELEQDGVALLVTGGGGSVFRAEPGPGSGAAATAASSSPSTSGAAATQGLPATVRYLGRVSDDDLAALYRSALCLAFPSLEEGFGIPIVEAMALGCPVVASDRSCLPEIGGGAAIHVDAMDPQAWVRAIRRLLQSSEERQHWVGAGREHVQRYSWDASARMYAELVLAA